MTSLFDSRRLVARLGLWLAGRAELERIQARAAADAEVRLLLMRREVEQLGFDAGYLAAQRELGAPQTRAAADEAERRAVAGLPPSERRRYERMADIERAARRRRTEASHDG